MGNWRHAKHYRIKQEKKRKGSFGGVHKQIMIKITAQSFQDLEIIVHGCAENQRQLEPKSQTHADQSNGLWAAHYSVNMWLLIHSIIITYLFFLLRKTNESSWSNFTGTQILPSSIIGNVRASSDSRTPSQFCHLASGYEFSCHIPAELVNSEHNTGRRWPRMNIDPRPQDPVHTLAFYRCSRPRFASVHEGAIKRDGRRMKREEYFPFLRKLRFFPRWAWWKKAAEQFLLDLGGFVAYWRPI